MDSIIIGFSKPKKWKPFAWLIMKGYNIPYDHVYIKFHSDSYKRDIIYQASQLAVNFMAPSIFFGVNDIVDEFEVKLSKKSKLKMVQFAMDNVGKPYGIKDCFGLAWVRICQLFGKTVKNPFQDKGATYVCSELGALVLENYAKLNIKEDLYDITPKDLFDYLQSLKSSDAKVVKLSKPQPR